MPFSVGPTLVRLEGISKSEQGNRLRYGYFQRSEYGKPTLSLGGGVLEKEMQMKAKGHQEPGVVVHTLDLSGLQQRQADLCERDPVSEKEGEKNQQISRTLSSYANPNFWKERTFLHSNPPHDFREWGRLWFSCIFTDQAALTQSVERLRIQLNPKNHSASLEGAGETGVQNVLWGVGDCGNWLRWLIPRMWVGETVLGIEPRWRAVLSSWLRGLEMNMALTQCVCPVILSNGHAVFNFWKFVPKTKHLTYILAPNNFKCEAWHWWLYEHWMADLEKLSPYDTGMLYPLSSH